MANVDTIVGVLVLTAILLMAALFLFDSSIDNVEEEKNSVQQSFQFDRAQTEFSTVLRHRPSGIPVWNMIRSHFASSSLRNPSFENKEEVERVLNDVYGDNQWYFEANWNVQDITISFVLDGSETIQPEREDLKQRLQDVKANLEEKLQEGSSVRINIFLLGEQVNCGPEFNQLGHCETVSEEMYELPPPYDVIQKPPVLKQGKTNAITSPNKLIEADWASGTGYAEYYFQEKQTSSQSNISERHIIFPVSDEFATNSIQNKCMTRDIDTSEDIAFTIICQLCDDTCGPQSTVYQRSIRAVDNTLDLLNTSNTIVNPVFSLKSNADFRPATSQPPVSSSINNTYGPLNPSRGERWCRDAPNCGGCSGTSPNIAFRNTSSCRQNLLDHMEKLANQTNGSTLSIQGNSLTNTVQNVVGSIIEDNPLNIKLGQPRGGERYVLSREIPLFSGYVANTNLYVYKKPTNTSLSLTDVFLQPPLISPQRNVTAVLKTPAEQPLRASVTHGNKSTPLRHVAGDVYVARPNLSPGTYTSRFEALTTDERASQTISGPEVTGHNEPSLVTDDVAVENKASLVESVDIEVQTTKPVSSVTAEILSPTGNRTSASLTGSGQTWQGSVSPSETGEHHVSITVDDGAERRFGYIDNFTVSDEQIPCDNNTMCPTQKPHCTSTQPSNHTCSDEKASEGMYATNASSCKDRLRLIEGQCIEPFTLAVVPVDFSFPADRSLFRDYVDEFKSLFQKRVFKMCDDPSKAVKTQLVQDDCDAASSPCRSTWQDLCSNQCGTNILTCAQDAYNDFDKAHAIIKGAPADSTTGCASLVPTPNVSKGSSIGGSAHYTDNFKAGYGSVHEVGHDFGLCHGLGSIGVRPCDPTQDGPSCNSGPSSDPTQGSCASCSSSYCPNDDDEGSNDIMNYGSVSPLRFSTQSKSKIRSHSQIKEIVQACS